VQVTTTFDLFSMSVPGTDNVMRLYGENGMLAGEGMLSYKVSRVRAPGEEPEPLPVPQRLLDKLPQVGDDVQNKWCALARDFVADIRGEEHRPYLTFQDGWRYQEAIDAIRLGNGWHHIPSYTQQTSIQVAEA
jgi:predicted dehydrogenase